MPGVPQRSAPQSRALTSWDLGESCSELLVTISRLSHLAPVGGVLGDEQPQNTAASGCPSEEAPFPSPGRPLLAGRNTEAREPLA